MNFIFLLGGLIIIFLFIFLLSVTFNVRGKPKLLKIVWYPILTAYFFLILYTSFQNQQVITNNFWIWNLESVLVFTIITAGMYYSLMNTLTLLIKKRYGKLLITNALIFLGVAYYIFNFFSNTPTTAEIINLIYYLSIMVLLHILLFIKSRIFHSSYKLSKFWIILSILYFLLALYLMPQHGMGDIAAAALLLLLFYIYILAGIYYSIRNLIKFIQQKSFNKLFFVNTIVILAYVLYTFLLIK